jgi:rhodanese-related sulfurtransferase
MLKQALLICLLSLGAGALRQFARHGIAWNGRWPTESTSAEEAYKMMAREGDPAFVPLADVIAIQENQKATLVDARSAEEYAAGHIPGSRSLPYYEMDKRQAVALEGLALDAPLVLYCEGVGCELSFFLGRELQAQGYTNISIFYGGYPEWSNAGLPVAKGAA